MDNNTFDYAVSSSAKLLKAKGDNLFSCLESRTKKALLDIGKELGMKNISALKKDELVFEIEKAILSFLKSSPKAHLEELISKDKKTTDTILKHFSENNLVPFSKCNSISEKAIRSGLVFSYNKDNEVYLIMPEEIKKQVLASDNYNKEQFKDFVKGIISLYGAYSLNSLVAFYNGETEEEISAEQAEKDIKSLKTISIKNGFIFDKVFAKENKKKLEEMLSKLKQGSFYKASFNEIMKHKDELYYGETAELTHLVRFATEYVTGSKIAAEKIVAEIVSKHRRCTSYSIESYTDIFKENGYGFKNLGVESKVVTLLTLALGTVRMWAYCGYTSIEVKKLKLSEMSKNKSINVKIPFISEKIGRNDPCPCGSGLKYKKCCGKNL